MRGSVAAMHRKGHGDTFEAAISVSVVSTHMNTRIIHQMRISAMTAPTKWTIQSPRVLGLPKLNMRESYQRWLKSRRRGGDQVGLR